MKKKSRVFFERNEYTGELSPFLQQQMQDFVQKANIEAEKSADFKSGKPAGSVSTVKPAGGSGKVKSCHNKAALTLSYSQRPDGRTVGVHVSLLEHKYADSDKPISPIAKRREVPLLKPDCRSSGDCRAGFNS